MKLLEKYGAFAKHRGWLLTHKLDLYENGNIAFNSSFTEDERKENFEIIYKNLRKYWQVFRAGEVLSAGKVFDILTKECSGCSRETGLTLANLKEGQGCDLLIKCLDKIKDIKKLKFNAVSTTAISKFLHFFNPKLFPIHDRNAIENGVLKIFNSDWKNFTPTVHSQSLYCGIRTYFRYILWANQVIRQNHKNIMSEFVNWFSGEVEQKNNSNEIICNMEEYYATAFEFIAIGASLIEEEDKRN